MTSNAIGSFQIGVSPIGTPIYDWFQTVISQYANSPRLLAILEAFTDAIDQNENIDNFYDLMWNVITAQGYGLDCWGRIVGVNRVLTVDGGSYLGFSEALPGSYPFNNQPFYGGPPSTGNYALTDDAYRQLILAKAAFNICEGSYPAINRLLKALFPNRGNAYVQDGDGTSLNFLGFSEAGQPYIDTFNNGVFYNGTGFSLMKISYVFNFVLTPVEFAIVSQSGVMPTPCGCKATIIINP